MSNNGTHEGALVKQENFGGHQIAHQADTQSAAVAAQAKASVEARWIVAMRQPRNLDQVRSDLMRECSRPSFAKVAIYNKPIGKGIEGPSIRFVEAAMQSLGNIDSEALTIYDDKEKRILEVRVTDYERNVCHRKQITVTKQVERSKPREDQAVLGKRMNSWGNPVYIVRATDDEIIDKEAALISKAVRACGLRLIPGWLVEECMAKCYEIRHKQDAADPDAARKNLLDHFGALGVEPKDIAELLGHDPKSLTPKELSYLRGVYAAVRDEEATWQAVIESKATAPDDSKPDESKAKSEPKPRGDGKKKTGSEKLKDQLSLNEGE